jgi:hypothetical protein
MTSDVIRQGAIIFRGEQCFWAKFTEGNNVDNSSRVYEKVGVRWRMLETMGKTKTRR